MHSDRMKEIGLHAVPPKGTPEWDLLQRHIKRNKNNPKIQELTKKIFETAVANCEVQQLNGADLPADSIIREYNMEYNNRVFNHSLHQLPSSFNVVEAFNEFIPSSATFQIYQEVDCIFSFDEYLDFITSDECPDSLDEIDDSMDEGVVYSFNSVDDPNNTMFTTQDNKEFGVLCVSLVRHKNEISILMLAGQECDLEKESNELNEIQVSGEYLNGIQPDESLKVEAVPLLPNSNLWRTIVLARIDTNTLTVDARHVYQDAGQSFVGYTDSIDCFVDHKGNFYSKELEQAYTEQRKLVENYNPLFELCKTALYLPTFRVEFEDTISIERHPTKFGEKRKKPSLRKINKLANSDLKIAFRNVEKIKAENRIPPSRREFLAPDLKVETKGFWKKLDFQSIGEDKNSQSIQGRTWVTKTLEWKESKKSKYPLQVTRKSASRDNEGYIYVMRSAAHEKNVFKVGLTRRDSDTRSKELSRSTSSPDHFLVVEDWEVSDCVLAEKLIHDKLGEYRVNPKREYFKAPYRVIFKIIDEVIETLSKDS
jgi:hypothetical protein